jgi:Asp-tRNA(Asn)/Glu-tRNA(Gln) amidotransferase A subunit family amidase
MAGNQILDLDVAALSEHLRGKKISPLEVTRAYLDRIAHIDQKIRAFITVTSDDALAALGSAISAPRIGEGRLVGQDETRVDVVDKILRFTAPFDCTGQLALAIPTGLGSDGLPLSMQIIGRPFDESAVLRVSSAYEAARGPIPPPPI